MLRSVWTGAYSNRSFPSSTKKSNILIAQPQARNIVAIHHFSNFVHSRNVSLILWKCKSYSESGELRNILFGEVMIQRRKRLQHYSGGWFVTAVATTLITPIPKINQFIRTWELAELGTPNFNTEIELEFDLELPQQQPNNQTTKQPTTVSVHSPNW